MIKSSSTTANVNYVRVSTFSEMHDHSNPILDLIFAFWRVETYGRLLELADHGQHMIKETPKVTPYTY